jgi:AmiR/NasT family two-component response regulator
MTENEVLFQISNIVNQGASYPQAVEQIAHLLEREAAAEHPRLAEFVETQLAMLQTRIRLAERRAELKRELAAIEEDLATRKLMQRAEGILIARRGMAPAVAQRWIAQQSQKTGLSKNDVADRIIAYYQATALLERRIAS